jgi:MFS family permease
MSRRWIVVALIFVGILISYTDRGNLSIAATSIMADFRLSPGNMGLLLSGFFWVYAVFQIPAGLIVDRIGIRRAYAGGFLIWSVASAAVALSRGSTDILWCRILLGLGETVGPIASLSFIRSAFSGPRQGLPTSIYVAGQNLGPAVGALIGTVLLDKLGWRAAFAITGLAGLLWLPGWLWFAPSDRRAARSGRTPTASWPARAILSSPAFWAMTFSILLASYYWYFVLTWLPAYLTLSRGLSTREMGRMFSIPLFGMAAVNIVGGFLADYLASRTGSVLRVRIAFTAVGYAGAASALLLLALPSKEAVLAILLVSMCSLGLGNSSYWAIAQFVPPAHMIGRTIGYLNTISQIAGALAPLITGWMLGPRKHFGPAIVVAGVAPALAAGCLALAGAKRLEGMKRLLSEANPEPEFR